MPILRVRDEDGNIVEIPAIKGDKGEPGDSGVIVGSYVGEGSTAPRYIPLAENVKAVLLATGGGYLPLTLLATDNSSLSNYAYLSYAGDIVNLAVLDNADVKNATYTYIAFTSKGVAP